jgi:16S rRNA G966 N2-methylase RsmD
MIDAMSCSSLATIDEPIRSPLRHLDADAVSAAARVETRNREIHLPPVSAYRWWARRTESINGAILDALKIDYPRRLLVVDPFAGGGVIPLAAVIRGHRTYAQDLNPWASSGLVGMLSLASVHQLAAAGARLREVAIPLLVQAYATTLSDGRPAEISHTFRVATAACPRCATALRLFPHALVSLRVRRERAQDVAFLACPWGHLFAGSEHGRQVCPDCGTLTDPTDEYTPGRLATCPSCGTTTKLRALAGGGNWNWQVALVERSVERNRELALPTSAEVDQAERGWAPSLALAEIPVGQETQVLRRHGFHTWADIYPARQRAVIERLLALAGEASQDPKVIRALRLAIVGSTEMAGLLSRWDRFYLKSYESMAGHRFNFTTFTAEPNAWGTEAAGRGSVSRRLASFDKAARWLRDRAPDGLEIEGPLPASRRRSVFPIKLDVRVVEGSSERMVLVSGSADVVLTDPPYHDDVQYDELSLPLRAWAEQSLDRLEGEAVVNAATGQNTSYKDYQDLLHRIFRECHRVLRPDGHLIFSYANREPAAWAAVLSALEAAGFRAVGYAVLASENETDVVKRQVRACNYDMLMDLCPKTVTAHEPFVPLQLPADAEGEFLALVGQVFMRVGKLGPDTLDQLVIALRSTAFLLGCSGTTVCCAKGSSPPARKTADAFAPIRSI